MATDKRGRKLPKGITQRPDGRYMGRFQYDGEQYTLYHKTSVKQLQKAMNDMRYELEHGLYASAKKVKVDEWFKTWMKEYKEGVVKPSTCNLYYTYYDLYIKETLGKKNLQDLKSIHIQKMYNELARQGLKENTVKKVDTIMSGMLRQAVRNEILIKNPCDAVEIPKTEKREKQILTADQQRELLVFVSNSNKWRKYTTLFTVALGTGMRIGELLALNWSDIDFNNKTININKTLQYLKNSKTKKYECVMQTPKTKTSKRVIPLLDSLAFLLRKHRKEQQLLKVRLGDKWQPIEKDDFKNLVFTTEFGRPFDRCAINRAINSIVKDMNKERNESNLFPNFTPHSLRHSFATRCFEQGIPPKVVQGYLGHSTIQMTMDLYTHVMEDVKQDEIKKLENVFKMA